MTTKLTEYQNTKRTIVSMSFGKDSTAMLHLMLDHEEKIDYAVYFESGWDFPQMEAHINQVEKNTGIRTIRIRYYRHFNELLYRYGWPHSSGGWCVRCKLLTCNRIIRSLNGTTECIGFTTNEFARANGSTIQKKKWIVRYPLMEYGFSEKDTLEYCRSLGYNWSGLYDVFDRVSCFCCPKAGKRRIKILKDKFPELYQRYLDMDTIAKEAMERLEK